MSAINTATTRRRVLAGTISVAAVLAGCGVGESQDTDDGAGPELLSAGSGVWIPRFMHFGARADEPVTALMIGLVAASDAVTVHFSNGRRFTCSAALTFASRGTDVRAGILVKNLASWVLDAAWRVLRTRVAPDDYRALRDNFGSFQRSTVLDAVSPGALFDLTVQITADTPRRLEWDGAGFRVRQ